MTDPRDRLNHRDIPLPVLREWAWTQSEITSMREVAARADVSRTTLAHFIRGETTPHPRIVRRIARLYLGESQAKARPSVSPEAATSAVQALVAGLPAPAQPEAVPAILSFVVELYVQLGNEPPSWARELVPGAQV
jgi:transcriptional regulator with XRE-family HTH domain